MSFFQTPPLGLDITDHSVTLVELKRSGSKITLSKYHQTGLPTGTVVQGKIIDPEVLHDIVLALLTEASLVLHKQTKLFFALSEYQTYSYQTVLPLKKNKNYTQSLERELPSSIPLETEDRTTIFQIEAEDKTSAILQSFSASKKIIREWTEFLKKISQGQLYIGPRAFALYEVLDIKDEKLPVLVIDINHSLAQIYAFTQEGLQFSFLISIPQTLSSPEQIHSFLAEKIAGALPVYTETYNITIDHAIIIGDLIDTDDFISTASEEFSFPIVRGINPLNKEDTTCPYLPAIGLAALGLDEHYVQKIPFFSTQEEAKIKIEQKKVLTHQTVEQSNENDDEDAAKLKRQIIILITVFFIGLFAVGFSLLYQSTQKKEHANELASSQINFEKTQDLFLNIPIAVAASEYTNDRVVGRLITDNIQSIGDSTEVTNISLSTVQKQTEKLETIWEIPVHIEIASTTTILTLNSPNTVHDYRLTWLAYEEKQANTLAEHTINAVLQKNNISYALSNIEKMRITPTDNPEIFLLNIKVTLSVHDEINQDILAEFK